MDTLEDLTKQKKQKNNNKKLYTRYPSLKSGAYVRSSQYMCISHITKRVCVALEPSSTYVHVHPLLQHDANMRDATIVNQALRSNKDQVVIWHHSFIMQTYMYATCIPTLVDRTALRLTTTFHHATDMENRGQDLMGRYMYYHA